MSEKMTREQFYEKYGDCLVKFHSYYKYVFSYCGTLPDGGNLCVDYGGEADAIYRHDVSCDGLIRVADLQPYSGGVYVNGVEVEGFYDF